MNFGASISRGVLFVGGVLTGVRIVFSSTANVLCRYLTVGVDMKVASADDVSVEVLVPIGGGLDVQFLSFMWKRGASTKLSRISRREISM